MEALTKWFHVFKHDGGIKAVENTGNMEKDYPELKDTWCIVTRANTKKQAIQRALKLDSSSAETDKIL